MLPLQGIRVLDLSRLLAGPFSTTILGDLGADILKVEALPKGDLYREAPPFTPAKAFRFSPSTATSAASASTSQRRRPGSGAGDGGYRRRCRRKLQARHHGEDGAVLRGALRSQSAADLRQHQRLRPNRSLRPFAGRRSDRARHVRLHEHYRTDRNRPDPRRRSHRRSRRGHVDRDRRTIGDYRPTARGGDSASILRCSPDWSACSRCRDNAISASAKCPRSPATSIPSVRPMACFTAATGRSIFPRRRRRCGSNSASISEWSGC